MVLSTSDASCRFLIKIFVGKLSSPEATGCAQGYINMTLLLIDVKILPLPKLTQTLKNEARKKVDVRYIIFTIIFVELGSIQ